jgi:uncharacterized protein (UPF0297 family)
MNKPLRYPMLLLSLAAMLVCAGTTWAAQKGSGRETADEFFLISSVNLPKHQMVLKLPTEVTMQLKVNEKTVILDEKGQHLTLGNLRSGDTAYITFRQNAEGATAVKIRLGPMTVEELHRRYLKGYSVPIPPPPPPRQRPVKNLQRGARTR